MKNLYNKDFVPNYKNTEIIDDNVRRLLAPNPSPFTFYGTGTYIIGKKELAIIDPGPKIDTHISSLLDLIEKTSLVHLFITHTHADHSPATRPHHRRQIRRQTRSMFY